MDITTTAYLFLAFHAGLPFTAIDKVTDDIISEHPDKVSAYLSAWSYVPHGAATGEVHAYVIETDGNAIASKVRTIHSTEQIEAHFSA